MKINLGKNLSGADVLLNQNALTKHAAVLGMTGSGKTGLLIGLTEELCKNKIPTILVDVKGDMTNIALQNNPNQSVRLLTPGASHGEPVNIFSDLSNPAKINSSVTALLKMIGMDVDPLKSKPHAYLSVILEKRLAQNLPCNLIDIIHAVQEPGFSHLGAMDLDFVIPRRTRTALASKLNNLLVAPSFQSWREGIPLEIKSLLAPPEAHKTPILIYSVAHLINTEERLLAISILLEEVLHWMRKQPGSETLKAALILDECYGLIPPHPANPVTKKPLLTMLKQGRAFGLGLVLATQNTMDLDYKGLANCQTWMIGRLQTSSDRRRVIEGICASGIYSEKNKLEQTIGGLMPRHFVVSRPGITETFNTRTVASSLVGPMDPITIEQAYDQGQIVAKDEVGLLMQRLQKARALWAKDKCNANYAKVAKLESDLFELEQVPHLTVVTG